MSDAYGKSSCIQKAARLVRGDRLVPLDTICEKQKTISTRKLARHLEKMREDLVLDGIFLSEVSKQLDDKALVENHVKLALLDAKSIAMRNTVEARIPECGDFGGIAQNLAFVCQELGITD